MKGANAYLHFAGNCREAMTFYKQCLGGELQLMTMGESPMGKDMPAKEKNNIMHAQLKSGDMVLMGSDAMRTGGITKGTNISMTISCSSTQEADTLFSKLSAGGKATHPMKQEFFGYYGDLTDKYGINWMLNFEKPNP